jgi:hypothetical protein
MTRASYSWSTTGYLLEIRPETSFARSGWLVMILLARAVHEKFRDVRWRAELRPAKDLSPAENMSAATTATRVYVDVVVMMEMLLPSTTMTEDCRRVRWRVEME